MMPASKDIWSAILSRSKDEVVETLDLLSEDELQYVTDHLHRMTSETGWQPSQIKSASFALKVIEKRAMSNKGNDHE